MANEPTPLQREVAGLRKEVAGLEAELASYTTVDKGILARGLAGGLGASALVVAVCAGVIAVAVTAAIALFTHWLQSWNIHF